MNPLRGGSPFLLLSVASEVTGHKVTRDVGASSSGGLSREAVPAYPAYARLASVHPFFRLLNSIEDSKDEDGWFVPFVQVTEHNAKSPRNGRWLRRT